MAEFFGKYRGKVVDTTDPLQLGRIKATVPALPGMVSNWATPCVPYAGPQVGFLALPPVGADVWIEFEGGDADHPIWSGCFWETGDVPVVYEKNADDPAQVKVWKTASTTLVIDDTKDSGEVSLVLDTPAVSQYPITVKLDSTGVLVETGSSSVKIEPENGITAKVSETTVVLEQQSIASTSNTITSTATPTKLELTGSAISATTTEASLEATASTSVTSAEVSVEGVTSVTGDTTVTGLMGVVGDTTVTGIFTVTGDSNLLGAVDVLGATTIAGATTVAGAFTVAGASSLLGGVVILGGGVVDGVPII